MSLLASFLTVQYLLCIAIAEDIDSCEGEDLLQNTYIGKNTLASSDSYRDNANTLLILPDAQSQYAPHFIQDQCARQSKLELPGTCFAIHSPQTWQHQEGYLSVQTLEHEFTKKWQSVIEEHSPYAYDAFFDYNVGFWVQYLDKYLKQLSDYSDVLTDYIGLQWNAPNPVEKAFYSLIIHSPDSQIIFELMSFHKPDLSLYPNLRQSFKFIETNEIRATFLTYTNGIEYPWNRADGADIVPIKLSFGCTDIEQHIEFYVNVLEAKVLYTERNIISSIDDVSISYAFLQSINDVLEIEFVERPITYTYGGFTVETYKTLLTETHDDRITSPTCGLDRWFDNHYGLNTLKLGEDDYNNYDYMDRVLMRLIERKLKYRIYLTPYQYESPAGKYWLDKYNKPGMYTLYVFDVNGQTVQMLGVFFHYTFYFDAPMYNKQWCYVPCLDNQEMGQFDPSKIYKETDDELLIVETTYRMVHVMKSEHYYFAIAALVFVLMLLISRAICKYIQTKECNDDKYDSELFQETECLVSTPPRIYTYF